MDFYVKMNELSEAVYDFDKTAEQVEQDVSDSVKSILNMADECWSGESQRTFLEDFNKWAKDCNKFVATNKTLSDYLVDNAEKASALLKSGQELHF